MSLLVLKVLAMLWVKSIPPDPACSGKLLGASCRAQLTDGDHDGVCLAVPGEAVLTCMPPPPPAP